MRSRESLHESRSRIFKNTKNTITEASNTALNNIFSFSPQLMGVYFRWFTLCNPSEILHKESRLESLKWAMPEPVHAIYNATIYNAIQKHW